MHGNNYQKNVMPHFGMKRQNDWLLYMQYPVRDSSPRPTARWNDDHIKFKIIEPTHFNTPHIFKKNYFSFVFFAIFKSYKQTAVGENKQKKQKDEAKPNHKQ